MAVTYAGNRPRQTTTNQRDQVGFCTVTSSLWNFFLRSHTFSRVLLRLHVIHVLIGYRIICVFCHWPACFLCWFYDTQLKTSLLHECSFSFALKMSCCFNCLVIEFTCDTHCGRLNGQQVKSGKLSLSPGLDSIDHNTC